jgi:hypothetical protein
MLSANRTYAHFHFPEFIPFKTYSYPYNRDIFCHTFFYHLFFLISFLYFFFTVINGEKAAVNNPLFAQKRERTLEMLIKNIHQGYMMETAKVISLIV